MARKISSSLLAASKLSMPVAGALDHLCSGSLTGRAVSHIRFLIILELLVPLLFVFKLVIFFGLMVPDAVRIGMRSGAHTLVSYEFLILTVPVSRLIPDRFLLLKPWLASASWILVVGLFLGEAFHWWLNYFVLALLG